MVNGVQQSPYEGTSMLYTFNDAHAPSGMRRKYFEMFCNPDLPQGLECGDEAPHAVADGWTEDAGL